MAIQVPGLREICKTVLKLVREMIYQFNSKKLENCRAQQLGTGNLHSSGKNQSQHCKAVSVSAINKSDCEFKQKRQKLLSGIHRFSLTVMYKQLLDEHKPCNTTLSLTQYHRHRLISLTSILYLSLQNCSTVTMVKTSIYDVNVKCAADTYSKFLL